MGSAVDDLETLELLGSTQWGLLTAAQAQDAGVTKMRLSRLVGRGTLQRVRHGVYALPSASGGPLQGLRAAWLSTDSQPVGAKPTAVVSGQSAAAAHGLGDLVPSTYEFSTPVRRQTTQKDVRYRTRDLSDSEVSEVDGLPVTTVARTVRDLAVGGTDQDHLAVVVRDALSAGTSSQSLARALEPRARTFGHADGQTYLVALLDVAGYQTDPAVTTTLEHISDAVAQALAPQMHQNVKKVVEQLARQSGMTTAAVVDPEVVARLVASMAPQNEALRASLRKSLAPQNEALRASLRKSLAPQNEALRASLQKSLAPQNEALRASLQKSLPQSTIQPLSETAAGTLASTPVGPPEVGALEEEADEEPAQPGRRSSVAKIAEHEAEHGGEETRRRS